MATVEIEAASEVECVVCGAKKFSMFAPYVCHRCWKNGNAAKLIVLLQASREAREHETITKLLP